MIVCSHSCVATFGLLEVRLFFCETLIYTKTEKKKKKKVRGGLEEYPTCTPMWRKAERTVKEGFCCPGQLLCGKSTNVKIETKKKSLF
jgi:hypothetical protein